MAVEIKCPACGGKTSTRNSLQLTAKLRSARVVCRNCDRPSDVTIEVTRNYDVLTKDNPLLHTYKIGDWHKESPANNEDQIPLAL
jgi:transcription elongation factor Elf1